MECIGARMALQLQKIDLETAPHPIPSPEYFRPFWGCAEEAEDAAEVPNIMMSGLQSLQTLHYNLAGEYHNL